MNVMLSATDVLAHFQLGTTALCPNDESGTQGCFRLLGRPGDEGL
jgi:hypothetical protein